MDFLPVSINIANKKILLVGGGKVALEKITSLKRFTSKITIISLMVKEEVRKEAETRGYKVIIKPYNVADIQGFFLVYACTNDVEKNKEIKNDCNRAGILVNVVDNPALCDFVSPAIYKKENMTVAVGSDGKDVKKSIAWRNRIKDFLDGKPQL